MHQGEFSSKFLVQSWPHLGGLTIIYRHEVQDDKIILYFTVKDSGIGLTEQELAKLFKPFSQANANISSKWVVDRVVVWNFDEISMKIRWKW